MPGIFGYAGRENLNLEELGQAMASSMKHEDWYVTDFITDSSCILGRVDSKPYTREGEQPIKSNDGLINMVMYGEIYNLKELKELEFLDTCSRDVESIITLYEKVGLNLVKYVNGLFIIAIYDKRKRKFFIINDRYGFFPVYYSLNNKRLVFGSEIKAILKDPTIHPTLNEEAIPEFLTFMYCLGTKTFFKGIELLPPASILTYDMKENKVQIEQYWDFSLNDQGRDINVYVKEFQRFMKQAVKRATEDKEKIGLFLSGGMDSRIIAGLAKETANKLITFTYGVKGCSEQVNARKVAEKLGVENIFLEIPSDFILKYAEKSVYRGEGIVSVRESYLMPIFEQIREIGVDTVLSGSFAEDWLVLPEQPFNGRVNTIDLKDSQSKEEMAKYLLRDLQAGISVEEYKNAFSDSFYDKIKEKFMINFYQTLDGIPFNSAEDIICYWMLRQRIRRWLYGISQYRAWFLKVRYPGLDNDYVNSFAFGVPPSLRVGRPIIRKILIDVFPPLAAIPYSRTGVPLNSKLVREREFLMGINMKFRGIVRKAIEKVSYGRLGLGASFYSYASNMVAYDKWLRTKPNKEYITEILLSNRALRRGFFKESYVRKIVQEHMSGKKNHEVIIYNLLTFELMNRTFFDKE